jgi:hypothetical protein
MMTVQTFRELLTQRPFKPFRLVMSSGQTYDVRHPEMALLTRSDLLVGIDATEDGVPAEFKICSLPHVSAIEPINSPSPGSRWARPSADIGARGGAGDAGVTCRSANALRKLRDVPPDRFLSSSRAFRLLLSQPLEQLSEIVAVPEQVVTNR